MSFCPCSVLHSHVSPTLIPLPLTNESLQPWRSAAGCTFLHGRPKSAPHPAHLKPSLPLKSEFLKTFQSTIPQYNIKSKQKRPVLPQAPYIHSRASTPPLPWPPWDFPWTGGPAIQLAPPHSGSLVLASALQPDRRCRSPSVPPMELCHDPAH